RPLTAGERTITMGDQGVVPPGGMTEYLDGLLHPPTSDPAPIRDLSSILLDPTQHFQLDLAQAPKAIAAFREAAEGLRDLKDDARQLAEISAPGLDAVSINAAKEIGQWAASHEPGSLRSALESGAMQLEKAADALEQSLNTYRNADETNAAHLSRSEL
ncbi:MAG: hypothetical protein LC644_10475, partial [Pseudonocardia sp.]|nr:hypothetical protein [Pseudonocardia sp.]